MDDPTYLSALSSNQSYVRSGEIQGWVAHRSVGRIRLPTGRLSIRDPHSGFRADFDSDMVFVEVDPGDYETVATIVEFDTGVCSCAAVTVVFRDERPVRWRAAIGNMQSPGGFGVDYGQGCLLDAATLPVLSDLDAEGEGGFLDQAVDSGEPVIPYVENGTTTILVFNCGLGDGAYPVYLGLGAAGDPVRAVVDLELLRELDRLDG